MKDITEQIQVMHRFFNTRKTYNVSLRLFYLNKLKSQILASESAIVSALRSDLKKNTTETYRTEIFMVLEELNYIIKHLKSWAKPKRVASTFPLIGCRSKILSEPYGVVAIYVPSNYPFQLALSPLIGAIAAGNCVVLKLSEDTPYTNRVLKKIIHRTFPPYLVHVLTGNIHVSQLLLKQPLDYIFFTGSTEVGKQIMSTAANHLIPVTLELGGKNPTIVDYSSDINLAAKRIVWGKFLNGGQTCVAPDYVLVHETIAEAFLEALKNAIQILYPHASQLTHIINEKHFVRLMRCMNEDKIIYGGHFNSEKHLIEPTLLYPVSLQDSCMQEEIFGPILPIIPFSKLNQAIQTVHRYPKPLACYIFGQDQSRIRYLLKQLSFGGGCINDTVIHLTNLHLPFGGLGYSGIGNYHGYYSFKTFSHSKSILSSSPFEMPLRYGNSLRQTKALKRFIALRFR